MSQSYPSQPAQYGTQYPAYPAGGYPSPYAQTPPTPYTDFTPGHSKSDQAAPQNENYLSPPDLSSITPRVASKTIQRLIASQLRDAEFDSAHPDALQRLELEVVTFVGRLYERAHEYANLANRARPITKDLMLACEEANLRTKDLHDVVLKNSEKMQTVQNLAFDDPSPRSPSPELLASDDESAPPVVPVTLRSLPPYLPGLPPKHTYLQTPASPPRKAALPSLDKKLKTAGLVQDSLRNLLVATDDSSGQEDGELLGHIVNWEASGHPRKRWKLSA